MSSRPRDLLDSIFVSADAGQDTMIGPEEHDRRISLYCIPCPFCKDGVCSHPECDFAGTKIEVAAWVRRAACPLGKW